MILRIFHVLIAIFVSSLEKLRTLRWNSRWGGNSPKSELLVVIAPAATILDSGANRMNVGIFFLHNDYDNGLLFQHFGLYNLFKSPVHFWKLCCLFSYYWVWEFFICFWYKSFINYILTNFFQFVPWLFIFFLKNFIIYCIFFFCTFKNNIDLFACGCDGSSLLHGLFSGCVAWASHCSGFSCCGARALGRSSFSSCDTWAQQLWLLGFKAKAQ